MGDFDLKKKELGFNFNHMDMRNTKASMQKLIRENYKKEKPWERYVPYIATAILLLLVGVAMYLIVDKVNVGLAASQESVNIAIQLSELQQQILAGLDNVCSGSGLRQV